MFEVFNTSAVNFGCDIGGGNVLFDTLRIEQGGRVLSETQAYNRLCSSILTSCQDSTQQQFTQSITEIQRGNSAQGAAAVVQQTLPHPAASANTRPYFKTAHNTTNQIPAGAGVRFVCPLYSGLFTQDKLIPLPLISANNPLTIVLRMTTTSLDCGVFSGAAAPAPGVLEIREAAYHAALIEVGGDVIQQMRMMQDMSGGQLVISGTDIEYTSGVIAANQSGEQVVRCPIRKRSLQSLFFTITSEDFGNGGGQMALLGKGGVYNLSYGGNANMISYQLKVGSVVYPPQPVRCWGNVAAAAAPNVVTADKQRGECLMELAKAFGTLGFVNPTGNLNTINYGVNTQQIAAPRLSDGDNGDGAGNTQAPGSGDVISTCPFGLDLSSFQHTAIESGVDNETMAEECNLVLDIDPVTVGVEDKTINMYMMYDQHYYFNSDGSVTFSN